MGTISNNQNSGQSRHDGQKNYQHSNQRNPDNIRDNTRDNKYQDYDEKLTNDANFTEGKPDAEMDFRDREENLESGDTK